MHNFFQENIPENITPLCSTMPEIKIDLNGVLKLLSNLKPDTPAGPHFIKPVVYLSICPFCSTLIMSITFSCAVSARVKRKIVGDKKCDSET